MVYVASRPLEMADLDLETVTQAHVQAVRMGQPGIVGPARQVVLFEAQPEVAAVPDEV